MSAHRALAQPTGERLLGMVVAGMGILPLATALSYWASLTRVSPPGAPVGLPLEAARFAGPHGPTLLVTGLMATDPDRLGTVTVGLIGASARATTEGKSEASHHGV